MAVTWKKLAYEADVITKALLTTTGDMIYASAANTPARLAIGTQYDVITPVGGVPTWTQNWTIPHHLGAHTAASAEVLFGGQIAKDMCLELSAEPPVTPVLGKIYFDTDLSAYICTAII